MGFPIEPERGSEANFLIQDPFELRQVIIPLLEFDENDLLTGLGTAFRIDSYGTHLTAQHVLDHRFTRAGRDGKYFGALIGLLSPGLVFGKAAIPRDCFAKISHSHTFRSNKDNPLLRLQGRSETDNIFDCLQLEFDPENQRSRNINKILKVRIKGRPLKIGDKVMAIGYPQLKSIIEAEPSQAITYIEELRGAIGEIRALHPSGCRSMKWPTFEVAASWAGGMSGGPIFNEHGEVVGLVSRGFEHEPDQVGCEFGFWFEPLSKLFEKWLPTIDASNPGWIRGWAVLAEDRWHIAGFFKAESDAVELQNQLGKGYEVRFGTHEHGTDNFVGL